MRGLVSYKLVPYKKTKYRKSIPGFSIGRSADAEDFFNVNIFFKCKYMRINDYSFKYVYVVCCLKIRFYYLIFSAMSNLNSADSTTSNYRSNRTEAFCKKGVFKNLTTFTGKHLCQSFFLNKVLQLY